MKTVANIRFCSGKNFFVQTLTFMPLLLGIPTFCTALQPQVECVLPDIATPKYGHVSKPNEKYVNFLYKNGVFAFLVY